MPVKNIIPGQKVTKEKLQRAKELRREMTPATPSALSGTSPKYDKLKAKCGFKIHIVGFGGGWWGSEVDGDVHDLQQEADARREKVVSELGLRMVRFKNDEIVRELSAVVGKIRELVSKQGS